MAIQPYLFFEGRCEEALEFYRKALGAEVVMLMRYKDSPEPAPKGARTPPGDKVMHSSLRIGDAELMASDGFAHGKPSFQGFSLSLNARDDAEARRWFNALADGGDVRQPLIKTFFSSSFGMVADRFGVPWMVVVPQGKK
ncbi:MAG TPA: VOC family protein [Burkholderiales bacterium]|jgi:PhnB protein|nr:VOC family protein [Burkholderiales bacterium]